MPSFFSTLGHVISLHFCLILSPDKEVLGEMQFCIPVSLLLL